jgi:glycerol-3-phosphate dehydrogenase
MTADGAFCLAALCNGPGNGDDAPMGSDVNQERAKRIDKLRTGTAFDVLVVGGGITGVGIALDLAARGLKPLVIDKGDWGGATSSASSRLVHGGLRYLEHFEFSLVRDSCLERALLLDNAAGFVWPEEFHFPVMRGDRVGATKLMAGLWLYTALATPRALGLPTRRSAAAVERRIPGIDRARLKGGGSYIDAATDDARLTLAIRQTAEREGATSLSRIEALSIEDRTTGPITRLRDLETGDEFEVTTKAVVLAGGPSTDALRSLCVFQTDASSKAREAAWTTPTRGSHIVLPRAKLPTDGAVIFTSAVDGRVMFLIPWPNHTIVGTTDIDDDAANPKDGSPRGRPVATAAEVQYLVDSAAALVPASKLTTDDVISTWAGLRPLLAAPPGKGPSERSREERMERDGNLFTIAGGKLTGYRSAAEQLGHMLTSALGIGLPDKASPTRKLRLEGALGGTIPRPAWSRLTPETSKVQALDSLALAWDARYAARGADVRAFCASRPAGLDMLDGRTLWGEVDWAVLFEDARGLVDFLFRRSDVGLGQQHFVAELIPALAERMGRLLDWSDECRAVQIDRATEELERRHAWRQE